MPPPNTPSTIPRQPIEGLPTSLVAPDEFWTIKDLCAFLKLGKSSIWDGVRTGRIPKPIKIGGSTRWSRQAVEHWLKTLAN